MDHDLKYQNTICYKNVLFNHLESENQETCTNQGHDKVQPLPDREFLY